MLPIRNAATMRSNASGIGTRLALRSGSRWILTDNWRQHSAPGQGLQPVVTGLGGARQLDFVSLIWSDGVFQTELDLAAGQLHRINETERQLSSCPVLFAWDGERYAFISDLLGVGGLGYFIEPGVTAPPRPRENFLLPASLPVPRDGHYVLKIGEPMEEVAYLDAVRLVAYDLPPGWVEYPYSQTMFAAWQAQADWRAPTLEARGSNGQWQVILKEFGYPAGMPRRMSVPLNGLPPGTTALRLRTNQEIYWDRVAVVQAGDLPQARRTTLPLASAHVAESGFARRSTGPQRQPHYDYTQRSPFWDTRYMAGHYTAFGPATDLVTAVDDATAIIGPGEEVHLEFSAGLPSLPAGWQRRFVLEANGWAKDMDLYTEQGTTLGPLPSSGLPDGPRDALHARYNTRYRDGR